MIPLLLVGLGGLALAAGWQLLRGLGPGARVGRIIAATSVVPVARAIELAHEGAPRYVGVLGRVDSDEELEDDDHRPLVLRRRRLELRRGDRWTAFEDIREVVPFEIGEGLERIAVDGDALDEGLVVVTRESVGTAADLVDRVPDATPPETPARFRLDLLSSVDHALVLGVPTLDPVRGPMLTAGLNRPLILTNLEAREAMRLLAEGRQGTARTISLLLGGGTAAVLAGVAWAMVDALVERRRAVAAVALATAGWLMAGASAFAASPSPTGAAGGDPRSSGQGPGLVGDPLLAILVVLAIALLSLGATLLYVRATGGSRGT